MRNLNFKMIERFCFAGGRLFRLDQGQFRLHPSAFCVFFCLVGQSASFLFVLKGFLFVLIRLRLLSLRDNRLLPFDVTKRPTARGAAKNHQNQTA